MSKILKAGETGFGVLIESDAGYINYDLNPTIINEGFELKPNEPVLINCILQKWGVKNKNGRIYPKDVLVPQVAEYQKLIEANSAVSESDHPDCVQASESEILTKDGWKWFKDISDDEEILTLNLESNKVEIQKIEKKIYEEYNGKMYKFTSNNINLTVTPNHRFLIEDSKGNRKYVYAKDIYENKDNIFYSGKNKLVKNAQWIGEYNEYFTLSGVDRKFLSFNLKHDLIDKYTQPINIKSEDWFAFMGFYLAEGHSTGTKSNQYKSNGYSVTVTQKNVEKRILFENLLNRLPFNYWITTNDGVYHYHINDARLYNYLFPLGHSHTKYIPNELKQASPDLLKILFDWFQLGDGRSIRSKDNTLLFRDSVFSTSKRLIDDLQEVLIKIGLNGNITTYQPPDRILYDIKKVKKEVVLSDGEIEYITETRKIPRLVKAENSQLQYNLNVSKTKNIYLDKRTIKIEEINFNDRIACVRVANGNFLVRVNGKSHWTGNSSIISLQNVSHMITKMWWGKGEFENVLYGQLKIIVSPGYVRYGVASVVGDKIVLYLQNKIRLGISSRGVGTLKDVNGENLVQNDFELIGFDLVATPSTPGAYLFPMSEPAGFNEIYTKKNGIYLKEDEQKIINALNNFLLL
jgi:intein/homing endonuclease